MNFLESLLSRLFLRKKHPNSVKSTTVLSHLIHTYELSEKERQGLPKYELSECMN